MSAIFLAAALISAALLINPTERQLVAVIRRLRRLEELEDKKTLDRLTTAEVDRLVGSLKMKITLIKKAEVWTYLSICFFLLAGLLEQLVDVFPAAVGFSAMIALFGVVALFGGVFLHIEIREIDLTETRRDVEIFERSRGAGAGKPAKKVAKK